MSKEKINTTTIDQSELAEDDFKAPSKYYFINAFGEAIFIHTRDRAVAERYITETYGKGFYKLRTSSIDRPKGDITCSGTNSRKGFSSRLKGLKG